MLHDAQPCIAGLRQMLQTHKHDTGPDGIPADHECELVGMLKADTPVAETYPHNVTGRCPCL